MVFKRKRFLIGGFVLVVAFGYLVYAAVPTFYRQYTVSELLGQESLTYSDTVRVDGQVLSGSVEQETVGRLLRFTMADKDGQGSLPVVYQGVVPDTFKPGSEVVVEGHINAEGIFQAHKLMAKCPTRYVPQ